ncbi:RIO1 family regulatory kinase/ATPase domain-containing protein [Bacillus sp. JJ1562]|uniref:RIO1 family regulatory kinase/ATPase domain-containing protein n=1 Tax=Bacillus sp. JJ1562 TaxID=3122960 RepID=UPI003002A073
MFDFSDIRIRKGKGNRVQVDNTLKYPLIGIGREGAVFKISPEKCVKMFHDPKRAKREFEALQRGSKSALFPRLYEAGENYVVMEYIEGITLDKAIKKGDLTTDLIHKMIHMLKEMKNLQFTKVNFAVKHAIITNNGDIKLIDHTDSFVINKPYPTRLLRLLRENGKLERFLNKVKEIDEQMFENWKQNIPQYL